jgi:hypothetical protein
MILRLNLIREMVRRTRQKEDAVRVRQLQTLCEIAAASDDRDRIYGILGLVGPAISSRITPNYRLPLSKVYADFAKALIETTGNLDIIHSGDRSKLRECFPSWIPDFRTNVGRAGPSCDYPFKAWGDRRAEVRFSDDGESLTCKGFRVDAIDGISGIADPILGNLPSSIVQPMNRSHQYGDEPGLLKALQQTLLGFLISPGYVLPGSLFDIPWISYKPIEPNTTHQLRECGWTKILNSEWYPDFAAFRLVNETFRVFGRAFREYFPQVIEPAQDVEQTELVMNLAAQSIWRRRLVTTVKGYLGLGVNAVEQGDEIFILLGCMVPVVLRDCGDCYKVVGELYVHGGLERDAMKWLETGECRLEEVTLC